MATTGSIMEPVRKRKRMIMYVSFRNRLKHIKLRYESTIYIRLLISYLTDHVRYAAGARFDVTMRHHAVIAFGPTMLHACTKLRQPRMYQEGAKHHCSLEQSRKYNTASIAPLVSIRPLLKVVIYLVVVRQVHRPVNQYTHPRCRHPLHPKRWI
jgi:hypothetical protein